MDSSTRLALLHLACLTLSAACSHRDGEPAVRAPEPGEGPLVPLASIAVVAEPWSVAAADLNGDGHADVVVGGAGVEVLLGDGAGGLARAPGSPVKGPTAAQDFAFGDFDGDGRTDLAVAEHDELPRFFLFLGAGDGRFAPAPASPFVVDAEPHLHTLAAFDFDGDGDLDVVTDSWPESRLVLVEGRGDGSLPVTKSRIQLGCSLLPTQVSAGTPCAPGSCSGGSGASSDHRSASRAHVDCSPSTA